MPESKGHLNPGSVGVEFDRFGLGADLSDLVRHVWVVRWAVPDGEVRPQRVLTYPALNAVIQPEPQHARAAARWLSAVTCEDEPVSQTSAAPA